jgi:hypothetical protein
VPATAESNIKMPRAFFRSRSESDDLLFRSEEEELAWVFWRFGSLPEGGPEEVVTRVAVPEDPLPAGVLNQEAHVGVPSNLPRPFPFRMARRSEMSASATSRAVR